MTSQQKSGNQLNKTLALRYKVIIEMFSRLCSCLCCCCAVV